ncbi:MAG: DUF504 domain-containing protein [Thaumarchaeota archaeon]|nr:MAG: DUF504 domain-containing protein [Nitrososphaerota archaeon]TLX89316.1 MAG: DUF504 domain-containing protein [Nitrososphaerota archaeon]
MRKKKGKLEEILSKARFYDDIELYQVSYRDFDNIVTIPLKEFILLSSNFELIPVSRIVEIKKGTTVMYSKSSINS